MSGRGPKLLTLALLAGGAALMLFPLWWMLVVSLETPSNAGAATVEVGAISAFPSDPQWGNWTAAMRAVGTVEWEGFLDALANSILITFLTVTATVISCSLVGYALARVRFRGGASAGASATSGRDDVRHRRRRGPPEDGTARDGDDAALTR